MRYHVPASGRLCACVLTAVLAVSAARAPAESVVVSYSHGHTIKAYDLDAGTARTLVGTPAYVGDPAVDSLAGDLYYVLTGGGARYVMQRDIATGAETEFHRRYEDDYTLSLEFDALAREAFMLYRSRPGGRYTYNTILQKDVDTGAVTTVYSVLVKDTLIGLDLNIDTSDIALDPLRRTIYWTDRKAGRIYRKCLDCATSSVQTVYSGLNWPFSLAVDPGAGLLFWSDNGSGSGPVLRSASIDGTGPVQIVANEGAHDLAVDPLERRIYWMSGNVRACDYNGANLGDVLHGGNTIIGDSLGLMLTPGSSASAPRMPDSTDPDGGFVFNLGNDIVSGPGRTNTVFIDPPSAIGYDYEVEGANFASVLLPTVGDGDYSLYLWDGSEFVFDQVLVGGQEHLFAPDGVGQFRIGGIEPEAEIDPDDPTAFMTGVSFTGPGPVDVTMTAIVPEPTTLFLLAVASGAFLCRRKRRTAAAR